MLAGSDSNICVSGSSANGSHLPNLAHDCSICVDIKQPHQHVLAGFLQLPGADGPGPVPHILPAQPSPRKSQTGVCLRASGSLFHVCLRYVFLKLTTSPLSLSSPSILKRCTARRPPSPRRWSRSWVEWLRSCHRRSWGASGWLTAGASPPWERSAPGATDRWVHAWQRPQ